jgi:nitrite reductase (NADH) large subunit
MNYLIIGNGVAGVEAALAIRKHDAEGEITIISESKNMFYYRPKVIEYLAGGMSADKLTLYKSDIYEKNRIRLVLDSRVIEINPSDKTVMDFMGSTYPYDRLLIATGARPSMPSVKGSSLRGVFTLRGITDADEIMEHCKSKSKIAVIGGGLLGLETANSLMKPGREITVVEFFEWLLPRQLDREGGAILQGMLEEKGLSFVLGDSVDHLEGRDLVEAVTLKSGRKIEADTVIFSAGILPRTEIVSTAGIAVEKGIVVNDFLQTSVSDIYAAGDPVQHRGRIYGIWPAAREQGIAAGLNMAGVPTKYEGTVMANILKITGIDLYSAGQHDSEGAEVICSMDGGYKKLMMKDNPVCAMILGDRDAIKLAQKVMDGKADPAELIKYIQKNEN